MRLIPLPTRLLFATDEVLYRIAVRTGLSFFADVGMWLVCGPIGERIMRAAVMAVPEGVTVAEIDCRTGTVTYIVGGHGWPVVKPAGSPC